MATNFRDKMTANTANLPSVEEMRARNNESKKGKKDDAERPRSRPQTAVGAMGALAAAESKLQEMQSRADPRKIAVAKITPNPWQPRRVFDDEAMENLKASIVEMGLIQPIVVREKPSAPGEFELIVGERRWRAHDSLGISDISSWVVELTDEDMAIWALSENLAREDLSDYEIAIAVSQTLEEVPSRKALAESLGVSRAQLYRYLSFMKLPPLVLETLDKDNPFLLGSNGAEALQRVLTELGDDGLNALTALWPDFVAGRIDQLKLPDAIRAHSNQRSRQPTEEKSVVRLFQKGKVAGHMKRDANTLTIKIKISELTEDNEKVLRDAVQALYQTDD